MLRDRAPQATGETGMSAVVQCSACGKRYQVGDSLAGKRVRCGCGKTLIVPAPRPARPGKDAAHEGLEQSLYEVIAPNNVRPDQKAPTNDLPDDLLDESIWDTGPKKSSPVEVSDRTDTAERASIAPPMPPPAAPFTEEERREPAASEEAEDQAETFWDRFRSPSRELIARLAIGYGAAMACLLLVMTVRAAAILSQFSSVAVALMIGNQSIWIAMAVLIAVGGVLIRKRHPLGPPCAGMAGVATSFSWLWSLLWEFHPLYLFLPIFAVHFVFIHSIPAYIIYWCLKQEEAAEEAARRDDHYAIRDAIRERMIEENQRRWSNENKQ